ncbi:MAG: hypothetical protein ACXVIY_01160, partial [Mucilaginibacter sp.]
MLGARAGCSLIRLQALGAKAGIRCHPWRNCIGGLLTRRHASPLIEFHPAQRNHQNYKPGNCRSAA